MIENDSNKSHYTVPQQQHHHHHRHCGVPFIYEALTIRFKFDFYAALLFFVYT